MKSKNFQVTVIKRLEYFWKHLSDVYKIQKIITCDFLTSFNFIYVLLHFMDGTRTNSINKKKPFRVERKSLILNVEWITSFYAGMKQFYSAVSISLYYVESSRGKKKKKLCKLAVVKGYTSQREVGSEWRILESFFSPAPHSGQRHTRHVKARRSSFSRLIPRFLFLSSYM